MNPALILIFKVFSAIFAVSGILFFLFETPSLTGLSIMIVTVGVAIALWRKELFK